MSRKFDPDHITEFDDGACIFEEGDSSREMYIIQTGEVLIKKKRKDGTIITLASLNRGDFFGEMSLLESLPRSASAYSVGKTRLLSIQPGGFLLRIRRDPTFAFEIIQALSKRIRNTNELALKGISECMDEKTECEKRLAIIFEKSSA